MNITKIADHPITMPLMWVAVIFMAGWLGRPMLKTYMATDFFTKAQAAEHIKNVSVELSALKEAQANTDRAITALAIEVGAGNAFQMIRGLEADLARHRAAPQDTHGWGTTEQRLVAKVGLARDYKDCVLYSKPNCYLIQRQIVR